MIYTFQQSGKMLDFLYNLITVVVTVVMKPKGTGSTDTTEPNFRKEYCEKARIEVKNNDRYCLFYALELARKFHDQKEIERYNKKEPTSIPRNELKGRKAFQNFINDLEAQRGNVLRLLKEANIPIDLSSYGIDEAERVQKYYDVKYPETYRIIIMDNNPAIKPLWCAPFCRYRYQVSIYYENAHYDALKSIGQYFYGQRVKYCIG